MYGRNTPKPCSDQKKSPRMPPNSDFFEHLLNIVNPRHSSLGSSAPALVIVACFQHTFVKKKKRKENNLGLKQFYQKWGLLKFGPGYTNFRNFPPPRPEKKKSFTSAAVRVVAFPEAIHIQRSTFLVPKMSANGRYFAIHNAFEIGERVIICIHFFFFLASRTSFDCCVSRSASCPMSSYYGNIMKQRDQYRNRGASRSAPRI